MKIDEFTCNWGTGIFAYQRPLLLLEKICQIRGDEATGEEIENSILGNGRRDSQAQVDYKHVKGIKFIGNERSEGNISMF